MNEIMLPSNFNQISLLYSRFVHRFLKHRINNILPQIVESGILYDGEDWAQAEYIHTGWTTTGNIFNDAIDFLECQRQSVEEDFEFSQVDRIFWSEMNE